MAKLILKPNLPRGVRNIPFGQPVQCHETTLAAEWQVPNDRKMEIRSLGEELKRVRREVEGPDSAYSDSRNSDIHRLADSVRRAGDFAAAFIALYKLLLPLNVPANRAGDTFANLFALQPGHVRSGPQPMTAGRIAAAEPDEVIGEDGRPVGVRGIPVTHDLELYRVAIAILRQLDYAAYYGVAGTTTGESFPVIPIVTHSEVILCMLSPLMRFDMQPTIGVDIHDDQVMESYMHAGHAVDLARDFGQNVIGGAVRELLQDTRLRAAHLIDIIEEGFWIPVRDAQNGAAYTRLRYPDLLDPIIMAGLESEAHLDREQAAAIRQEYAGWEATHAERTGAALDRIVQAMVRSRVLFPDGWSHQMMVLMQATEEVAFAMPPWYMDRLGRMLHAVAPVGRNAGD